MGLKWPRRDVYQTDGLIDILRQSQDVPSIFLAQAMVLCLNLLKCWGSAHGEALGLQLSKLGLTTEDILHHGAWLRPDFKPPSKPLLRWGVAADGAPMPLAAGLSRTICQS